MGRRSALILGFSLVAVFVPIAKGDEARANVIVLFPTRNSAGDAAVATAVDRTLRFELSQYGSIVGPEPIRAALRRLRIRNGDHAPPAFLRLLGEELAADWLVSATLHDVVRRQVPTLTVSARVYSGTTGELIWSGFEGASGIDRRKLLGLGTIEDPEALVSHLARKLLKELPPISESTATGRSPNRRTSLSDLGTLAIIPFSGSTARRNTVNAETVTEAARAQFFRSGVDLVSPNLSYEILRQQQSGRWGGVTADTWTALQTTAGADAILTGEVETYDIGGSELEPRPHVTVAMRLLDATSGRIVWTGALERSGWDGQGLLGLGRIYSRGALTAEMMEILTRRLDRERIRITQQSGSDR